MSDDIRKKKYRLLDLANQIDKETWKLLPAGQERDDLRKLWKEFKAEVNSWAT